MGGKKDKVIREESLKFLGSDAPRIIPGVYRSGKYLATRFPGDYVLVESSRIKGCTSEAKVALEPP